MCQAINIRSEEHEKPDDSMNDNIEKLCRPRWRHSTCVNSSHVLAVRFQLEILATAALPRSIRSNYGSDTMSKKDRKEGQEEKVSLHAVEKVFV